MTETPDTPDELREEIRAQLRWTGVLFGQPADLRSRIALADWRQLKRWIRGLEALALRLVRALAATLSPDPDPRPPGPSRRQPRIERAPPDTDHPDSARWTGVRVRLLTAGARPRAPATPVAEHLYPDEPRRDGLRDAKSLALRLEAVIRVAENPERYARRLVRASARPARSRTARRRRPRPCGAGPRLRVLGAPAPPGRRPTASG